MSGPYSKEGTSSAFSWLQGGGETGEIIRTKDWSKTPVGPIESWPQTLSTALSICLLSKQPMFVWWKTDQDNLTIFYNDAYIPIAAAKHPDQIGADPRSPKGWAEMWPYLKPLVDSVFLERTATWNENLFLPIYRKEDLLEEAYWSFSYSPVITGEGSEVAGMYCSTTETTKQVVGERRLKLLRNLATGSALPNVPDVTAHAMRQLAEDPQDVPFALLYLVSTDDRRCELAATSGLEAKGAASPAAVPLDTDGPRHVWPLAEAYRSGRAVRVNGLRATLGDALPRGPWDEPSDEAVVFPISAPSRREPVGFLVAGLSPRLRFDADYENFFNLVTGQLATNIANASAIEAERRRAEALAEIDRAKTAFFSNVSHEFRTPLTLMMSPLEEALAKPDAELGPGVRALLDIAQRNSVRLLRLVNTLLDFTRIEAGRVQARYEPVDLAALTADLAANFRSATERAGLRLRIDCPTLPQPVHVDRDMWEKVVLNLVSNAFKFTFAGEIAVEMRASSDSRRAVLTVRDTGVGVPPDELPRLFERFHRVEGQRSRSFEGSGIGLALVQELVKLHGGEIEVESEVGRGTAFRIALPFGTAHLPQYLVGAEFPQASTSLRPDAFVEEALRWLPDGGGEADHGLAAGEPIALSGETGRVLVADDNADMRDYVRRLLRDWDVEAVADGQAALEAMRRRRPDVLLSDVMMPRLGGFGLLRAIRADPDLRDLPVILLSARAGEEARVEGLDVGADDYLTKPFSARELSARLRANLTLARVRRETTEALRRSNETLEARVAERTGERNQLWELSRDLLLRCGFDGRILTANPAWTEVLGWSEDELLGTSLFDLIHPDDLARTREAANAHGEGESYARFENRYRQRDGGYRWISWSTRPAHGVITAAGRDVTHEKAASEALRQAEEQLRQKQKTEAIGQLTGGVAHDFNNLLAAILSNLDLLRKRTTDAGSVRLLDGAIKGAERGAALTSRLLAFARRQDLKAESVDVGALVSGMHDLLSRSLGTGVRLAVDVPPELPPVSVDPNQLELAILNLAVNARDAMPKGGTLTIAAEASPSTVPDAPGGLQPGDYVRIAVGDEGEGMDEATLARAVEPFFTTKGVGKGTGLGLSMVQGLAHQSGGGFAIRSEPGRGTVVSLWLPRAVGRDTAAATAAAPKPAEVKQSRRALTVLVVDDDVLVGMGTAAMLEDLGHTTIEAASGAAAIEILATRADIDIVVTDQSMPGMTGLELAAAIRHTKPDLPVVLATGYADLSGEQQTGLPKLSKPFRQDELAVVIDRLTIDARNSTRIGVG